MVNISSTTIEKVLCVDGLKHKLLRIIQLCVKGYKISFNFPCCEIVSTNDKQIKIVGHRFENIYMVNLNEISPRTPQCPISKSEDMWFWHRRLGKIHMDHLNK